MVPVGLSGEAEVSVACLFIRDFLIALVCRERPELALKPVILGSVSGEQAEVRACSRSAAAAGVAPGMTVQRALALCREAIFVTGREADAVDEFTRIVTFLREVSPAVEPLEPGHVHFEIRGLAALGGMAEDAYLDDLATAVRNMAGLPVGLGASSTVFAAHAAAVKAASQGQSAAYQIVRSPREFVGALPLEALSVPYEIQERLRRLGLRKLGEVGSLPLHAMQAQFGSAGAYAWRLSQGECDARVRPQPEELCARAEMDLPSPVIEAGPVVAATQILLKRALSQVDVDGRAARRMEWRLTLESGESLVRRFVFREPTRDTDRIMTLLRSRVERLILPAPGISLVLALDGFCSEPGHQAGLWASGPRHRRELLDALAQIRARAGGPQVYRVIEVQPWSRIPERRLALAPYDR